MKKIFIFLLISITFMSCDPIHEAEIKNSTNNDIIFQISFNKESIEEGSRSHFLNYFPGFERIKALSVDTVKLICTYEIKAGESFPLHSKIAEDPDFNLFKELLLIKNDTLSLKNKEIPNAFKQTRDRHWELVIE